MKPMISIPFSIRFSIPLLLAFATTGCLYTGDETLGLPCNTDTECGGTQLCVERVCGGPTMVDTDSTGIMPGASSEETVGSAEAQSGNDDDEVRTECLASETECLDSGVLRQCIDGKLETFACEGWCGQGTEHNGCATNPGGVDECLCLNPKLACDDEGVMRCDGNNIVQCTDGFEEPFDCDTVCLDAGYSGVDYCATGDSGEPTCFCDSGCTEGSSRCVDDTTAQDCWNGVWESPYDCNSVCPEGTYSHGCTYFAGDTESCGCWEY